MEKAPIDIGPYLEKRLTASPTVTKSREKAKRIDIGPYRARKFVLDLSDRLSVYAIAGTGLMEKVPDYEREDLVYLLPSFNYIIKHGEVDINTPKSNKFNLFTVRRGGKSRLVLSVGIDLVNNGPQILETGDDKSILGPFWPIAVNVVGEIGDKVNPGYNFQR